MRWSKGITNKMDRESKRENKRRWRNRNYERGEWKEKERKRQ